MNQANTRTLAVHGALTVGILAGAWLLGVRPMQESLDQAHSERAINADRIAEFQSLDQHALAQPQLLVAKLTARGQRINKSFAISGSDAALYEELGRLADRTGVQIERMEPHRTRDIASSVSGEELLPVRSSGYTINFKGSFDQCLGFIAAVEHETGLCILSGCRLVQGGIEDGTPQLLGTITTEHFALAKPLVIAPTDHDGASP